MKTEADRKKNRPGSLAARAGLSAAAVALLAAVFAGLEFAARRCFPPENKGLMPTYAQYIRFLAENSGPFFKVVREGGQERLVQIPDIWESARGQNFPLRKPPGARRVVVLGESSADALASSLQRLAGTEPAAASLEVMDCAAGGGDLELMERRFNEVMRYSPDVVVVLFGHNLFYHHPYRSPLWRSLSRFLRRSRLLALAADRLLSFKSYFSPHPSSARWAALENFLRLAARRTQKRGVTLILCTVPGNLWYPPDGGVRERRDPRYLRALFLANTGREREAVAELREAALFEPSALWHFQLADWLYQEKDYPGARAQLILARDLDPARERASSAVNTLIRETARDEHLELFDAAGLVDDQAPHGIPGWESFKDNQHVHGGLFYEEAEVLLRLILSGIRREPPGFAPLPRRKPAFWSRPSWPQEMIHLSGSPAWPSILYMARTQNGFFARNAPFIRARLRDPSRLARIYFCFAEAFWRAGRRAQAWKMNQSVRNLAPGWSRGYFQQGLFDLRAQDGARASAAFARALKADPDDFAAAYFLKELGGGS